MTQVYRQPYRSPNRRHDRQFFYKYVKADIAKIILVTRKLRWSSPLLFNDPFDITQELRLNFDEAELNAALAEELALLIEKGDAPPVPNHPALAALLRAPIVWNRNNPDVLKKIAAELRDEPIGLTAGQIESFSALKEVWRDIVTGMRILCASELNDVTSMWLHYTDQYRGAVLEFECVDEIGSPFLVARPVIYQDSLPEIAEKQAWVRCMLGLSDKTITDLFTEYQYIKTMAWSYEKEWRVISFALPGESEMFADYLFHPRELSAIYLGERCAEQDLSDILSLLTHGLEHVSAYRAFLNGAQPKFMFRKIR
jgi:hypothetical protein